MGSKAKCIKKKVERIKVCNEEADQGHNDCSQQSNQGYNNCSLATNNKIKNCTSWGWLSGLCIAFSWLDNWVCVAWTWVENMVCVAWIWVKKMVCLSWSYITTFVCLIWLYVETVWDFIKEIFRHIWWTLVYWNSGIKCNNPKNKIQKDGLTLIFNDEFDNNILDTSNKWRTRANWMVRSTLPANSWGVYPFYDEINPLQYFDDSCLIINNDILTITSEYAPKSFDYIDPVTLINSHWDISYKSGWIETLQKFHYGFFEMRCKIPDSSGSWPAFWLAWAPTWPPEIDIFEFSTSDFTKSIQKTNIHWDSSNKMKSKGHRICDTSKDFNIYGFEWREGYMKWYFNNVLIRTEKENMNEFIYPMNVIIGSGMENYFAKPSIIEGLPHKFEIDYIRIYK